MKKIALILSLLIFTQGSLFAYSAETNFWKERQKAVIANPEGTRHSREGGDDGKILLASLPQASGGMVLPFSSKALSDLGVSQSLSRDQKRILTRSHIPLWIQEAVAPYATIQSISKPPFALRASGGKSKTILLVQDVHLHLEAHTNIAGLVEKLGKASNGRSSSLLIGMEGADTPGIDLTPYAQIPDRWIVKGIAEALLKARVLNGVEEAVIGYKEEGQEGPVQLPFQLMGLENQSEFDANVQSIKDGYALRPKAEEFLAQYKQRLTELKGEVGRHSRREGPPRRIRPLADGNPASLASQDTGSPIETFGDDGKRQTHSPGFQEFDNQLIAYEEGKLAVPDYVLYLNFIVPASTQQLRKMIEAALIEGTLNFSKVESERTQVLENLLEKMKKEEIKELVQLSSLFRAGEIAASDYYNHLKSVCLSHGIDFADTPEMNLYVQYVIKSESIDATALMGEMKVLEEKVMEAVSKTPAEKQLLADTKNYYLTKKLTEFALTEDEWKEYLSRHSRGGFNSSSSNVLIEDPVSLKTLDSRPPKDGYPSGYLRGNDVLKPFESFYEIATTRNKTMASKMADRLLASNVDTGLLLAGGFHTQGLLEELKKRNLTILTLSPKITQMGEGLSSVEVLASGRLPLDRLFTGERLFVPLPLETAGPRPAAMIPPAAQSVANLEKGIDTRERSAGFETSAQPGSLGKTEKGAMRLVVEFAKPEAKINGSVTISYRRTENESSKPSILKPTIKKTNQSASILPSQLKKLTAWAAIATFSTISMMAGQSGSFGSQVMVGSAVLDNVGGAVLLLLVSYILNFIFMGISEGRIPSLLPSRSKIRGTLLIAAIILIFIFMVGDASAVPIDLTGAQTGTNPSWEAHSSTFGLLFVLGLVFLGVVVDRVAVNKDQPEKEGAVVEKANGDEGLSLEGKFGVAALVMALTGLVLRCLSRMKFWSWMGMISLAGTIAPQAAEKTKEIVATHAPRLAEVGQAAGNGHPVLWAIGMIAIALILIAVVAFVGLEIWDRVYTSRQRNQEERLRREEINKLNKTIEGVLKEVEACFPVDRDHVRVLGLKGLEAFFDPSENVVGSVVMTTFDHLHPRILVNIDRDEIKEVAENLKAYSVSPEPGRETALELAVAWKAVQAILSNEYQIDASETGDVPFLKMPPVSMGDLKVRLLGALETDVDKAWGANRPKFPEAIRHLRAVMNLKPGDRPEQLFGQHTDALNQLFPVTKNVLSRFFPDREHVSYEGTTVKISGLSIPGHRVTPTTVQEAVGFMKAQDKRLYPGFERLTKTAADDSYEWTDDEASPMNQSGLNAIDLASFNDDLMPIIKLLASVDINSKNTRRIHLGMLNTEVEVREILETAANKAHAKTVRELLEREKDVGNVTYAKDSHPELKSNDISASLGDILQQISETSVEYRRVNIYTKRELIVTPYESLKNIAIHLIQVFPVTVTSPSGTVTTYLYAMKQA